MVGSIYYSGIYYVVYVLKDPMYTVDNPMGTPMKVIADTALQDSPSQITQLADLFGGNGLMGLTLPEVNPIKKVLVDDYYVFSQDFYDRVPDAQSLFEAAVNRYIDGEVANIRDLQTLCSTIHAWDRLESYYYSPILFILIRRH